jgi:methylenetetrahydrofolate reductase (NADPH)
VHIPDEIISRLKGATDQSAEGVNICIDMINLLREIDGVSGVHIMAYRQEHRVAEIVTRSNVLEGRIPWHPGRDCAAEPGGLTRDTVTNNGEKLRNTGVK